LFIPKDIIESADLHRVIIMLAQIYLSSEPFNLYRKNRGHKET